MQFQVKVVREIPGEYVRAGAAYTVTRQGNSPKRSTYHFRNNETGGATFVQSWAFDAAVKRGDVVTAQ